MGELDGRRWHVRGPEPPAPQSSGSDRHNPRVATQKQRRRRLKEKRHDYDLVYVDEEGVEQPVERDDNPRKPPARVGKGTSATKSQGSAPSGKSKGRRGRTAQPPSWRRVMRRGAIFAPIFLASVMLLGGNKITFSAAIVQTVLLVGVFVPFSYFMDKVVWRQQQKRLSRGA
jgi:hypothetical protein